MRKIPVILLLLFLSTTAQAQFLKLSGNVKDTAGKQALPNTLLMAIKFKDSTLVGFSHTNADGFFKPIQVPIDTYIVILSHSGFSDKTYLLVPSEKDSVFRFKNVVLPPKSIELNEVEIIAFKEKSYYKGDTLIFTADSFKTAANATVEDLLKKLPGVKVDAKGKITIQGKEVDQVLVDGDEFFGSDPTMATKNLNATIVENVQVYDKKNESSESDKETLKVVNLKLKEDSKKGYFGKVSGATDAQQFYENDLLINRFKGSQKLSVFGLMSNTPKNGFSWGENDKYGLANENKYSYDPETNSWTNNGDDRSGIPQTNKAGFYFTDKIGKKTKINSDYSFNSNQLLMGTETNVQYFFTDTSYFNKQRIHNSNANQSHRFNFGIVQKLDSLTELTVKPKLNVVVIENNNQQADEFLTSESVLTRQTTMTNSNSTQNVDGNVFFKLNRNFMKKDRNINITYQPSMGDSKGNTDFQTDFTFVNDPSLDSVLLQKKDQKGSRFDQTAGINYIEPFTKKWKMELRYNFSRNQNNTTKHSYNFDGQDYNQLNTLQSNDFRNLFLIHNGGAKFIYDVKKYRVSFGSAYRNISQENINVTKTETLNVNVGNFLPNAAFVWRINQGSNFNVNYNTNFKQPDLQQLQPIVDNSDPNRIKVGNPDLKPQYNNNVTVNYYFYKGVSDVNFYAGSYFNNAGNEINETTYFDSIGRSVTQPLNVNGNYFGSLYMGGGFPVLKRFFKINYNLNSSFNNNTSYLNFQKNVTQHFNVSPGLNLEKRADKFEVEVGGNYQYNIPKQTINAGSIQPYFTYDMTAVVMVKFSKQFMLRSDAKYTNNGNRSAGYNINYLIWNASISKAFLKTENLITSLELNDILNQNISNQRDIEANKITDVKTQIIKRYFLVRLLYKFNNQKTKQEDDY